MVSKPGEREVPSHGWVVEPGVGSKPCDTKWHGFSYQLEYAKEATTDAASVARNQPSQKTNWDEVLSAIPEAEPPVSEPPSSYGKSRRRSTRRGSTFFKEVPSFFKSSSQVELDESAHESNEAKTQTVRRASFTGPRRSSLNKSNTADASPRESAAGILLCWITTASH